MGGKKAAGENSKKVAGNARKAEAAAAKQAAADAKVAAVEDEQWGKGSKSSKKTEDAAAKKAEAAAKKAERDALLAAEEASQPAKPKNAGKKTAEKKTRGPTLDLSQLDGDDNGKHTALNATGIDNALDALSLAGSSNDVRLERHPERRYKAAYEAFEAWRLPEIVDENKGSSLRRNQMIEMCRKEFEKRPENPFNQVGNVSHNATREELAAKRGEIRSGVEKRLGER